jgi:hypothetical protein
MIVTKTTSSENIERESLATHVELCAQRIDTINKRIIELQSKQEKLESSVAASKFLVIKTISVATAVLTSAISLTVIILDRIH